MLSLARDENKYSFEDEYKNENKNRLVNHGFNKDNLCVIIIYYY